MPSTRVVSPYPGDTLKRRSQEAPYLLEPRGFLPKGVSHPFHDPDTCAGSQIKSLHSWTLSTRCEMAPLLARGVCCSNAHTCASAAPPTPDWFLPPTVAYCPSAMVQFAKMTAGPTDAGSAADASWMSCHWPHGCCEMTLPAMSHTREGNGLTDGLGDANREFDADANGDRSGYKNSVSASACAPISQLQPGRAGQHAFGVARP